MTIPLIGYTDKLSARPGDTISFMVSSTDKQPFTVQLVRIISADPNPEGAGIIEQKIVSPINGDYPSRVQPFYPGSYGNIKNAAAITGDGSFTLSANIFPTLPGGTEQTVLAIDNASLFIDKDGKIAGRVGHHTISIDSPLKRNTWYRNVEMSYNATTGLLKIEHAPADNKFLSSPTSASANIGNINFNQTGAITIAAKLNNGIPSQHFNGKIESPKIFCGSEEKNRILLANWDFSKDISSTRIKDIGPHKLDGELLNLPTRAVTGSNWTADEMCWRHAPEQYAAIHFHDDDIYDFCWQSDFSLTIPENLDSGIYAARIHCGEFTDAMPFFVCPPKGKRRADLCVIVSTFTYVIYGNHARPDFKQTWNDRIKAWKAYPHTPAQHKEYGLSTYNTHSDGTGICHASHRRPLFNLRPGYLTFGDDKGSGLRHFQADSHLISWLHAKGYEYDIITDQELHDEGVESIAGYKTVTTGTHPEYHTTQTLNALQSYRDLGGKLMYLGGNGFYWRIALHESENGALEIRRNEGGIRAWASASGEYYNAFDGTYGGLWRRNARPPQQLVGVGFSAQGQFSGSPYVRKTGSAAPPCSAWLFSGITDEIIGDFGLSGGGAAGFELDRVDYQLGSPDTIEIVASSEKHDDSFILVPEEQLTHIKTLSGEPIKNLLRADMVYFTTLQGGEVFSTGSICFCGSLPCNNFDNNISALLKNVLDKFLR